MTQQSSEKTLPLSTGKSWISPYQLSLTRLTVGLLMLGYLALFPLEVPLDANGSNDWLELPRLPRGLSRLLAFLLAWLLILGWWRRATTGLSVILMAFLAAFGRVDPVVAGLLSASLVASLVPAGDDPLALPPFSATGGKEPRLPPYYCQLVWLWLSLPLVLGILLAPPWLSVPGSELLGAGLTLGALLVAVRKRSSAAAWSVLAVWALALLITSGPFALPVWASAFLLCLNRDWLPPRTPQRLAEDPASLDEPDPAIVFYDGVCGLCQISIQLIVAEDRDARLKHAPLQGKTATRLLHTAPNQEFDSLKLHEAGLTYERSTGALRIATYLGGFWMVISWLRLVPISIRDRAYDFVATNRYAWFGRLDACRIPSPNEKTRFLD